MNEPPGAVVRRPCPPRALARGRRLVPWFRPLAARTLPDAPRRAVASAGQCVSTNRGVSGPCSRTRRTAGADRQRRGQKPNLRKRPWRRFGRLNRRLREEKGRLDQSSSRPWRFGLRRGEAAGRIVGLEVEQTLGRRRHRALTPTIRSRTLRNAGRRERLVTHAMIQAALNQADLVQAAVDRYIIAATRLRAVARQPAADQRGREEQTEHTNCANEFHLRSNQIVGKAPHLVARLSRSASRVKQKVESIPKSTENL